MTKTTTQKMRDALKINENHDISYNSTSDNMLDVLFMSEYFTHHLGEVDELVGDGERWKLFSMFMRDPRFGLGRRDLGRRLMRLTGVDPADVIVAGRYDDLFYACDKETAFSLLRDEIMKGNELAKKWAPRYSSKNRTLAREFARFLHLNKQQYGKFVKGKTVERSLSSKNTSLIKFEHVPSLAMVKYYDRFNRGLDTRERFENYLQDVADGKKELKVSTTTVYDIYRNRTKINPDLFFDKIEKIAISCIPVVDTSGSMWDNVDSVGKALSIGHYLAKCSTFLPNHVVSFSSNPHLIELGGERTFAKRYGVPSSLKLDPENESQYMREIQSMYTGDCSNTDFRKVMELFAELDELPEYLVVLSDQEFDEGSHQKKWQVQKLWKEKGYTTKIVWWNFNPRNKTVAEMDDCGNIYLSGYSPMLLKYLEAGFDGEQFLNKLLDEYEKKVFK